MALAKLIHHPFCSSWLLPFLVSALSFLLIPTSHLPPLLKTSLTYFVTHTKISDLNTHVAWHKTSPKPPILTSFLLTVPLSSNPIPFRCLLVTQGSILRDATSAHPLFTSFLILCLLAINDEAQQGGQSGFTILAALLSRFCLQIFTGDREQTRTGTGEDFLKEELLKRLSHKNIGFLGKPNPLLPHELTSSLCAALSHCPNLHPLCNLLLHWPHIPSLTSTSPKPSMMPRVFNPILFPIPKAS